MRIFDRFLIFVYLAIALVPAVTLVARTPDHRLAGVEPEPRTPRLRLGAIITERFQRELTAWFEAKLGVRGYEVMIDNSILYHLFGETRYGAGVHIGEAGVLFENDDLAFYNRTAESLPGDEVIDAAADKFAAIQRRLRGEHRLFLPFLSPSKATVYRDAVPARWKRDIGEPRPSDAMYLRWKAALDKRGVEYIDVRALMQASGKDRAVLWRPTGRHWSAYTGCLVMKDAMARYARLQSREYSYDCTVETSVGDLANSDFDLWSLMNVSASPASLESTNVSRHESVAVTGPKPRLLVMGTSFCWALLHDAVASMQFSRALMNYYNRSMADGTNREMWDIAVGGARWHDEILGNDIYLIDSYEIYVVPSSDFVAQFGAALAPPL